MPRPTPVSSERVKAPATSASLDLVSVDRASSLMLHEALGQVWSSSCKKVLQECSTSTGSTKCEKRYQVCQATSGDASGTRRPTIHADLLLDSWKTYTLTQAPGRPVSAPQAAGQYVGQCVSTLLVIASLQVGAACRHLYIKASCARRRAHRAPRLRRSFRK